jgi:putative ABC transport system ATP-binding protein
MARGQDQTARCIEEVSVADGNWVVTCRDLGRVYGTEAVPVRALTGVDIDIARGEFVSLSGPSGSGKSTLLNLIGALDRPTEGDVVVDGVALGGLDEAQRSDLRLTKIGFVFQAYNLIPVLSARENVEFIMQLQGVAARERRSRALEILESLGIADLADRRPGELSGGQQQRVAVARAIVTKPALLLADEPSANLDSATTETLLDLLRRINVERHVTIVTATHDPIVMRYARRRIRLKDGRVIADERADGSADERSGVEGA